jgi:hypothetical protein
MVAAPVYKRAVELMEADLGDELVALDAERGNCFGFNEVGTWVWRRLAAPTSFEVLRDGLLDEYDVGSEQCSAELRELLDEMTAKGLIVAA